MEFLDLIAATFTIIAALFFVLEKYQTQESSKVRDTISNFWHQINVDKWADLPERSIRHFIEFAKSTVAFGYGFIDGATKDPTFFYLCAASPFLVHLARFPNVLAYIVPKLLPLGLTACLLNLTIFHWKRKGQDEPLWRKWGRIASQTIFALWFGLSILNDTLTKYGQAIFTPVLIVNLIWYLFATFLIVVLFLKIVKIEKFKIFFLLLAIIFSWFLYITGLLDVSRWYIISLSNQGVLASQGSLLSFPKALFILWLGALFMGISLFSIVDVFAKLISMLFRRELKKEYVILSWSSINISLFFTGLAFTLGAFFSPQSKAEMSGQLLLMPS